ncbi:MAG: Fe-S cluster assembly protein SufD, partial [Nocardioides sp.]
MTDTAPARVADSLEAAKVDSHLHPEGSFDLADHPVPTGREEIWRFTPLKRLRDLHADADLSGTAVVVEADAPEGVVIEELEVGHAL